MRISKKPKPLVLAVLMVLATLLRSHEASAQEPGVLIVAGGCFWCVESDFESVPGVTGAISGYIGGNTDDPTYKQVSKGDTGHYEAVQIFFDPQTVNRETLLNLFFRSVDPTDAGGQFCDRGESYRTAIFVSNAGEKALAEGVRTQAQRELGQTIVTPILPVSQFYPAETYHQDYYKGRKIVITRFGPKRQSEAYKRYRQACRRDARVLELWGDAAPFVGEH